MNEENKTNVNSPIAELDVVMAGTNRLMVEDNKRAVLVATLIPIAQRIGELIAYANVVKVETAAEAEDAANNRNMMMADSATAEKALREFDSNLVERLHKTHRAWTALIGKFTDPLGDAAKKVKQKIIAWQTAEAEKAERERAALQAKLDEDARKERERLEREAAKLKTPELKQQRMEAAAQVVVPVVQVAALAKAVKTQARWFVVGVDKAVFVKAAAKDKSLLGYVEVDKGKLERAKAANSELECAGVNFAKKFV